MAVTGMQAFLGEGANRMCVFALQNQNSIVRYTANRMNKTVFAGIEYTNPFLDVQNHLLQQFLIIWENNKNIYYSKQFDCRFIIKRKESAAQTPNINWLILIQYFHDPIPSDAHCVLSHSAIWTEPPLRFDKPFTHSDSNTNPKFQSIAFLYCV